MKLSNIIQSRSQDQRWLGQDLEEWLSSRGSQPDRGFLSGEEKKESTKIESAAPEGAKISNQAA